MKEVKDILEKRNLYFSKIEEDPPVMVMRCSECGRVMKETFYKGISERYECECGYAIR